MFLVPTAAAGEVRSGGTVEIKQGETVPDDLYVFAETVLVNGTIQGDLISFSTKLVVGPTGVIEGDLLAAGQALDIQGTSRMTPGLPRLSLRWAIPPKSAMMSWRLDIAWKVNQAARSADHWLLPVFRHCSPVP